MQLLFSRFQIFIIHFFVFLMLLFLIGFFNIKIHEVATYFIGLYLITLMVVLYFHQLMKVSLLNLLLMSSSILLTFFICDFVLKQSDYIHSKIYYRPHERFSCVQYASPVEIGHYRPNIEYEGWAYGDLAAMSQQLKDKEDRRISFYTDHLGFRNQKKQAQKKNDIILLGDSYAVSSGTTQDSMAVNLLAQQTQKEVYNLSYPGYSFDQLTRLALNLPQINTTEKPTLLWFIFSGNDFQEASQLNEMVLDHIQKGTVHAIFQKSFFQKINLKIAHFYRKSPIRLLLMRTFSSTSKNQKSIILRDFIKKEKIYFLQEYVHTAKAKKTALKASPNYQVLKSTFSRAKDFCQQHSLDLQLVFIPSKYEVYGWLEDELPIWTRPTQPSAFNQLMNDLCQELDIAIFDSTPAFIEAAEPLYKSEKKWLWWRDDTHLNGKGNEVLAKIIAKEIFK